MLREEHRHVAASDYKPSLLTERKCNSIQHFVEVMLKMQVCFAHVLFVENEPEAYATEPALYPSLSLPAH